MLYTIYHQGLRLSLGAFCNTPVEIHYVAADTPSLSETRDKLSLQSSSSGCRLLAKVGCNGPPLTSVLRKSLALHQRVARPFCDVVIPFRSGASPTSAALHFAVIEISYHTFMTHEMKTCVGADSHSSSADKCCGVRAKESIFIVEAVALRMALDTVSTSRKETFLIPSNPLSLNVQYYGLHKRTSYTWWRKILHFLFELSFINANTLFNTSGSFHDPGFKKWPLSDFKENLLESMCELNAVEKVATEIPRPVNTLD
ncbi:hypothetical protein EGW08_008403 [Elysia chlorotica]|uniref:Uncharacterized protein n=1 Tax=Elysia chlorotica TaxID=188477 RepID=A0A3S0ZR12_ELYCH|nr:hypothetical protein EGW08_008403 [Elysia chlorotica]